MSTKFKVLIIIGSLREKSYNAAIARQLADLAPDNLELVYAPSLARCLTITRMCRMPAFPRKSRRLPTPLWRPMA